MDCSFSCQQVALSCNDGRLRAFGGLAWCFSRYSSSTDASVTG
jgi:hypothetical protein